MDVIAKSDIFFFITALAVLIVAGLLIAALVYVIRILRDIKSLSEKIEEGGEAIADDISGVHGSIKTGIAKALRAVKRVVKRKPAQHKNKKKLLAK